MGDAEGTGGGLFGECGFAFVPSNSLAPRVISELSNVLQDHGAAIHEPRRDGSLPIDRVTHIISNTIDFPQYTESQAMMIPVVTVQWITTSLSRRKQPNVRPYSPDPRMIFARVTVTCADLPPMDKESIIGATMALGGQESKDVGKLTTHICALSMDHPKVQNALANRWKGKVVLPHWFDDCFKLGKRIDEGPYLLPNPEILKKTADDELKVPDSKNLDGATSANPRTLPLPSHTDGARPPVTIFQDRRVLLSWDLNISGRLTTAISEIISQGGGRVVKELEDCNMLICQYRDGPQYVQAAQSGIEIGNLSWLYYLIVHNDWTSPLRRLLHYPIPRQGIEGFQDARITVSNYGGEARIYLENLIVASGAEFTKTMTPNNTHLITARNTSDKCKAAPEWGIAVINHLWIEESYAKCEMKPLNANKYNHFPPRTNLGEIIGQTFLDESRLKELFYPGGDSSLSPRAKRKRDLMEAAEVTTYQDGPAEGLLRSSGLDDEVLQDVDENRRSRKRASADADFVTPLRRRDVGSGKENGTPLSTGGRSAKNKARDMLHQIAPDIALYEKEKKRHSKDGHAPWGGKRAADLTEKERTPKQAAKQAEEEDDEEEDEEGEVKRPAKRSRPSLPGVDMRVILTGYTRWVGDQKKEDVERRKLREMGIQIVQEGQPCDYLAAPSVVRTVKFLRALARGPTVVSSDFIDAALDNGEIPDPDDFVLKDPGSEKEYDFKLSRSIARAKSNRGKLLQGVPIYCTEKIRNGVDSYKAIAEANGAIFKVYRARSGTTIKPTTAEEDGNALPEPVYLLTTNTGEEMQMWPRFRDMAQKGNMEPRVVAADWLLDVAMAQQVRFDKKFLVENHFDGK